MNQMSFSQQKQIATIYYSRNLV